MYKNILVPIDLAHGAGLEQTAAVAKALTTEPSKITLAYVIEIVPAYMAADIPTEIILQNEERAKKDLNTLRDEALPGANTLILHGKAHTTILDHSAANDVDCIIISSHKPGLQDYFLGSTAARVVRHAQCAVHVTR